MNNQPVSTTSAHRRTSQMTSKDEITVTKSIGFVPIERPPKLGKWEGFRLFMWNSKDNSVLGRTGQSWVKILAFYLCFYTGLTVLFAICFATLLSTLNLKHPVYLQDESLIGSNPGLGFRPISETVDIDGSLIWYSAKDQSKKWVDIIDNFLEPYRQENLNSNQITCDFKTRPSEEQVCRVNIADWAPCNSEHGYSYDNSTPCIFIKLNKIYGWTPKYYTDLTDVPDAMPDDVRRRIMTSREDDVETVWVSCHGENPMDQEIIGDIEYYPKQGFAGYYFPYLNVVGYLSPLVAVRFANPMRHVLINVECRAWAKNIIYSNTKGIREGSVHFEILID